MKIQLDRALTFSVAGIHHADIRLVQQRLFSGAQMNIAVCEMAAELCIDDGVIG